MDRKESQAQVAAFQGECVRLRRVCWEALKAANELERYGRQVKMLWRRVARLNRFLTRDAPDLVAEVVSALFVAYAQRTEVTPVIVVQGLEKAFEAVEKAEGNEQEVADRAIDALEAAGIDMNFPLGRMPE